MKERFVPDPGLSREKFDLDGLHVPREPFRPRIFAKQRMNAELAMQNREVAGGRKNGGGRLLSWPQPLASRLRRT